MTDERQKTRLSQEQLDAKMQLENFSIKDFNSLEMPPILPEHDEQDRPHILMLDDDEAFLASIDMVFESSPYQRAFTLHTLVIGEQVTHPNDITEWVLKQEPAVQKHLAIFVDRNHPGFKPSELFDSLKKNNKTRYIPVAFMTAAAMQQDDIEQVISVGAQRILYNKRSTSFFLYECASILDQLHDGSEKDKWNDLRGELANDIAESQNNEKDLPTFPRTDEFLKTYLNVDEWLVRSLDSLDNLISCKSLSQHNYLPELLAPNTVPFMDKALKEKEPFKIDSLSLVNLGQIKELKNCLAYRLLAAPLRYGNETLGTLTLFRNPEHKPFRQADIQLIAPIAAMLSFFVGQNQAQQTLRQRQEELLNVVIEVDKCTKPEQILRALLLRLHQDIHRNENNCSKTTSRLFIPATGELKRQEMFYGIKPKEHELSIYSAKSTHAKAVTTGKPVYFGNIARNREGKWAQTAEGMTSCFTVPLLAAGGLRLGSVNMEHQQEDFYRPADKIYAESLCRVAANALFRLRGDAFKCGLIDLIRLLNQPDTEVFQAIYKLLYDYMGYAQLLLLEPASVYDAPWQVKKVVSHGTELDNEEINRWQNHFNQTWSESFTKKVIQGKEHNFFTNDVKIKDEEMGITTESQAVIRIHGKESMRPDHALVLFFLVKDALNAEQLELLKHFGSFFNILIQHRQKSLGHYIQAVTQDQKEQAINQQRHSLKSTIGALGNIVSSFKKDLIDKTAFVAEIEEEITKTSSILASYRHYMKDEPEFKEVHLSKVWQKAIIDVYDERTSSHITIKPFSETLTWCTDSDLLGAVFSNLIQNALEAGANKVWSEIKMTEDELRIRICDNGSGISAENQSKLFRLGSTTKNSGTGFGLNYCRDTMQRLGGEIYFQPNSRHTCFTLYIPKKVSNEK